MIGSVVQAQGGQFYPWSKPRLAFSLPCRWLIVLLSSLESEKERHNKMSTVRQVIYISKAADDFAASDLRELAEVSARNNKLRGITGALLYIDNCFIQVIEGDEGSMSDLLAKLEADPRHCNIRIISDRLEKCRHFPDWSMGLISTPDDERPGVVRELRSVSEITDGEKASDTIMPIPNTVAMMQRLYETDSILQHARR
jgi:Sensors of blue-light using FAD